MKENVTNCDTYCFKSWGFFLLLMRFFYFTTDASTRDSSRRAGKFQAQLQKFFYCPLLHKKLLSCQKLNRHWTTHLYNIKIIKFISSYLGLTDKLFSNKVNVIWLISLFFYLDISSFSVNCWLPIALIFMSLRYTSLSYFFFKTNCHLCIRSF